MIIKDWRRKIVSALGYKRDFQGVPLKGSLNHQYIGWS